MASSRRSFPMATITGPFASYGRCRLARTILAGACCLITASMASAALIPEGSIGPLSYVTDAAFNLAFRETRGGGGLAINTVDGVTGLYHSARRAESKVWDSVNAANATDISVFPLVAGQPLRTYTDFRLNMFDANSNLRTAGSFQVPLALVSPDGTRSYTGSVYTNEASTHFWNATTAKVSLRLEDFDFVIGPGVNDRNSALSNTSTPAVVEIDHTKWYRFEMVVERQTDAPTSGAIVTLNLYGLADGQQGGAIGSLIHSLEVTRTNLSSDGLGDWVQFGTLAAVDGGRLWMDNYGLEIVPEPTTAALLFGSGVLLVGYRRR